MVGPMAATAAVTRTRCGSSGMCSSTEDGSDLNQSIEVPGDFISERNSESSCDDEFSCSYEQSMPIEYFTKL